MDKKLKQQLKTIITGHRPRPLMYVGYHNGRKCYVRKQDLTYWQLRDKYPSKPRWDKLLKGKHIFAPQHHLTPHRLRRKIGSYVVWGFIISFAAVASYLYIAGFIGALL